MLLQAREKKTEDPKTFHVELKFCAINRCCALLVNEAMGHPNQLDRQEKIYDAEFRRKNSLSTFLKQQSYW